MKHLGDIKNINGGTVTPVHCITFGSPCQDLSVAGKRAGLDGERSGLFTEAIRIIKEMREATNGEYPYSAIWENVPGAFSSNSGEDFRSVLEQFASIIQEDAVIPRPPKGKWQKAGLILLDGGSLAWRLFDAQYWGVPQRRKRIALVADLRGHHAGDILFEKVVAESQGLSGHPQQSSQERQGSAGDSEDGSGADDPSGLMPCTLKIRSGCEGGARDL